MLIHGVIASSYKAGGSFESIATATSSGSTSTITFSSIPSTYKHLQIRVLAKTTNTASAASAYVYAKFNSDSTGANYVWHQLQGNGTTVSATGGTNNGQCYFPNLALTSEATLANMFGVGIIDIHDYASTTKNKTVRSFSGANTNSTSTAIRLSLDSNLWINTAAINRIDLTADNTFAAGSTFALYGIKGS